MTSNPVNRVSKWFPSVFLTDLSFSAEKAFSGEKGKWAIDPRPSYYIIRNIIGLFLTKPRTRACDSFRSWKGPSLSPHNTSCKHRTDDMLKSKVKSTIFVMLSQLTPVVDEMRVASCLMFTQSQDWQNYEPGVPFQESTCFDNMHFNDQHYLNQLSSVAAKAHSVGNFRTLGRKGGLVSFVSRG